MNISILPRIYNVHRYYCILLIPKRKVYKTLSFLSPDTWHVKRRGWLQCDYSWNTMLGQALSIKQENLPSRWQILLSDILHTWMSSDMSSYQLKKGAKSLELFIIYAPRSSQSDLHMQCTHIFLVRTLQNLGQF